MHNSQISFKNSRFPFNSEYYNSIITYLLNIQYSIILIFKFFINKFHANHFKNHVLELLAEFLH